jgi:hypothetical protein
MTARPAGVPMPRTGRLGRGGLFGGGIGGFVVLILIVIQIVRALAPGPTPTPCVGGGPCGAPPTGAPPSGPQAGLLALTPEQLWRSSDLGYEFDFDPKLWSIQKESATDVILRSNEPGSPFLVWISGVQASEATPDQLMAARFRDLRSQVLGLERNDGAPILGPAIGYLRGVGARYVGQVDSPQGPGVHVDVDIMAATDRGVTAAVAVVSDHGATEEALQQADSLLNTFLWPGGSP